MEKHEDQIRAILAAADWRMLATIMRVANWTWAMPEEHYPEAAELEKAARRLLERAAESGRSCSSGGFEARYETGCLLLGFILASVEWCDTATGGYASGGGIWC